MSYRDKVRIEPDGRRVRMSQALRWVKEQRTHDWVVENVSIRKLSVAEMVARRADDARQAALREGVMGCGEIPGCRFVPPPNTTYRPPWKECEEMDSPMFFRECRWPREMSA